MTKQLVDGAGSSGYAEWARTPLASLFLLLPLLAFHELSLLFGDGIGGGETVEAYRMIERVVAALGVVGAALPALITLAILIGWHALRRDPLRLRPGYLGMMFVESLIWVVPLFILQGVLGQALLAAAETGLDSVGLLGRINIAIGAGLYEELVFRLLLVGFLRWALIELFAVKAMTASLVSVGLSAVLFGLYHDPFGMVSGSGHSPGVSQGVGLLVLYVVGGLYFGGLFLSRGLGIAAAAHAWYDIWVIATTYS